MKTILLLILSFALFGCETTTKGEKCVTIEMVYTDESIDELIEVCTDQEFLLGVLEENQDEIGLETNDSSSDVYLNGLKGYNFETLKMNYYWAVYVNSDYAIYGVAKQPIADGDVFKFEATSY